MLLEAIQFPEPVIAIAIEPKTKTDQEKMAAALGRLCSKTHAAIRTDEETGQP